VIFVNKGSSMEKDVRINVIGSGSWGTALAIVVNRAERQTLLWGREAQVVDDMNATHRNKKYLPRIALPKTIIATNDLKQVVDCEVLLVSVPVPVIRHMCVEMKAVGLRRETVLVLCAKGIEVDTQKLTSEIVEDILPGQKVAILSGPNFAREVALAKPAASTLACKDLGQGIALAQLMGSSSFRVYVSTDVVGVQLAGAVKNVLAIACGIARGVGFGENTVAALVTRGLAEIGRLIKAKGGDMTTIMGLAGVGDVMLTCSSLKSRNTSFGNDLGQGMPIKDALAKQKTVVEGVKTAESVYQLAQALQVEMPICEQVYRILYENYDIDEAIHILLARPLTTENGI
jgi:glycerol-3-phosphate dehydrogenase (NAD(P)+)